jgi:xanthine dehydrogenase iron-sulfur cluster and FAD-binding subunit A
MLAVQADGSTLRTVEALAPQPGRLSVLQEAFRRHHALQCGFCTPGILMSLDIFVRTTSQPGEVQIRDWLSGHLCHCTGYVMVARPAAKRHPLSLWNATPFLQVLSARATPFVRLESMALPASFSMRPARNAEKGRQRCSRGRRLMSHRRPCAVLRMRLKSPPC